MVIMSWDVPPRCSQEHNPVAPGPLQVRGGLPWYPAGWRFTKKKNMKKMMFLGVAQLIWETSRYGQPPLLTMPQMSSVQKPLTIPVYSHSLPPKFPPCFRGLGFGFRGDMCVCAHPIVILYMHKRFRGASANGLRILASAGPSAALPRLSFSFREGIVVDDFG